MPAETRRLLELWTAARARGEECALATVVRVAGSSYRKPGARMLITRDGQRAGTVSGGCLEGEVSRKLWWLTENGSCVRDYSTSFDDDSQPSYGLGCDGVVTLLLERGLGAGEVFQALGRAVHDRAPSAIVTVTGTDLPHISPGMRLVLAKETSPARSDGLPESLAQTLLPIALDTLRLERSTAHTIQLADGAIDLFAEYLAPPPALFIFGAGDDAHPVCQLAHSMGWAVTVADGRSHLATPTRFPLAGRVFVLSPEDSLQNLAIMPGDSAVVLTHSYLQDLSILRALLPLELGYLGILGPRRRTERIVDEVATSLGVDPGAALTSLKSPVGLDLGTGSAEVIALSIIAEIQSVLTSRSAAPLTRSAIALTPAMHG